ncbi:MAG: helix-turn-helix domain-containing protein [Puniceicoccaceae bacterium]|nr:MAG: helix-turn-helix domain-containing protein [Puniceicoccaceae bacterium]
MDIFLLNDDLRFRGPGGSLAVRPDDEISRRLAMLLAGECGDLGVAEAARRFGFSRQRYHQLRSLFLEHGAGALAPQTRGPKTDYRRTDEAIRLVIRLRFLDPQASAEVIAQKLRQLGHPISVRSVERIIADYGLQKKTLRT